MRPLRARERVTALCQAEQEGGAAAPVFSAKEKTGLIWNEGVRVAEGRAGVCGMKPRGLVRPISRAVELQIGDHGDGGRGGTQGHCRSELEPVGGRMSLGRMWFPVVTYRMPCAPGGPPLARGAGDRSPHAATLHVFFPGPSSQQQPPAQQDPRGGGFSADTSAHPRMLAAPFIHCFDPLTD